MSDHAFNVYQTLWFELNTLIDTALEKETQETREYVVERLNDEFKFLEHLYVKENKKKSKRNDF